MKNIFCAAALTLLLMTITFLAFNVQPVRSDYVWTETIYIRSDGSVEPLGAPISTVDNVTYTLTDNINVGNVLSGTNAIVVERDNILVDGANYKLNKGYSEQLTRGMYLSGRSNVTIKRLSMWGYFRIGIYLESSYGVSISGNAMYLSLGEGIQMFACSDNVISGNDYIYAGDGVGVGIYSGGLNNSIIGNNIWRCWLEGIYLGSSNSSVVGNTMPDNYIGIRIGAHYNVISGNTVTGSRYGVECLGSYNVIMENNVKNNVECGVVIHDSNYNNSIIGNNITNNRDYGISFYGTSNNTISGNTITSNGCGIRQNGGYNSISGNNITSNGYGVLLYSGSDNSYWHNNFLANTQQVVVDHSEGVNAWDDDYPSGGNYWSDYTGVDVKKGPSQDSPGSDGIGDTPLTIDDNNRDRYPLMYPYGSLLPSTFALTISAGNYGTTDPAPETYIYSKGQNVPVHAIPNTEYALDHWELDGTNAGSLNPCSVLMDKNHTLHATFRVAFHDVAVTNVTAFQAIVGQGFCTEINVTAENQGDFTESFNVTVYANTTQIGKQTVTGLDSGANKILTFSWNTTDFDIGNYTVSAVADTVTNETDTLDNTYLDGTVTVRLPIHDVAVVGVSPFLNVVLKGLSLDINVTVENQGELTETFHVTAYANTTAIGEKEVTLNSGESAILVFAWNTTEFSLGNYSISANATIVAGETDTDDNTCVNGAVTVRGPGDIAVVDATPAKTVVGQGYSMSINIHVKNQGDYTETFNVTAYINETIVATITNVTLTSGNTATITFTWNTTDFPKGNYTISAYASPVPGETDTDDNTFIDGIVLVGVPCDVTGPTPGVPDGICNMRDIGYMCDHFGTTPSSLNWNPNCDVTGYAWGVPDGIVNMRDIGEACNNFGNTDP